MIGRPYPSPRTLVASIVVVLVGAAAVGISSCSADCLPPSVWCRGSDVRPFVPGEWRAYADASLRTPVEADFAWTGGTILLIPRATWWDRALARFGVRPRRTADEYVEAELARGEGDSLVARFDRRGR